MSSVSRREGDEVCNLYRSVLCPCEPKELWVSQSRGGCQGTCWPLTCPPLWHLGVAETHLGIHSYSSVKSPPLCRQNLWFSFYQENTVRSDQMSFQWLHNITCQRLWDITPMIMLCFIQYHLANWLALYNLFLPPSTADFEDSSFHEFFSCRKMNTTNKLYGWSLYPSPVKPSDKNPVLSDILQKMQPSHSQIGDPQVRWNNNCGMF